MQLSLPSVPVSPSPTSGTPDGSDPRGVVKKAISGAAPAASFDQLLPHANEPVVKAGKAANALADQMTGEAAVLFSGCMLLNQPPPDKSVALVGTPISSTAAAAADKEGELRGPSESKGQTAESTFGLPVKAGSGPTAALTSTLDAGAKGGLPTMAKDCQEGANDAAATTNGVTASKGEAEVSRRGVVETTAATATTPALNQGETIAAAANPEQTGANALLQAGVTSSGPAMAGVERSRATVGAPRSRIQGQPSIEGEKIAVGRNSQGLDGRSTESSAIRNFLNPDEEEVNSSENGLGTDVAKGSGTMSALAHRSPPSAGNPALDTLGGTAKPADSPAAATTAADAHRAVDAVLAATERLGTSATRAVNLQFSFGGADLAVRVEVRGGEVHATFRTNSAELRDSLSSEWHAAAAQNSASPLRMVEPVFRNSESAALGNSTGESGTQQRNSNAHESESNNFASLFPGDPASSGDASYAAPRLTQAVQPSTSLRLHTFA